MFRVRKPASHLVQALIHQSPVCAEHFASRSVATSAKLMSWQNQPPYCPEDSKKAFNATYEGSCHCEAVRFKIKGEPVGVKYCHCKGCQRTHVYPKNSVLFTAGHDKLEFYNTETGEVDRKLPSKVLCKECHSPLANEGKNMMMVLPTTIAFGDEGVPDTFKPTAHVFYGSRVLDMIDGVPKWSGLDNKSDEIDEQEEHKTAHHQNGKGKGEKVQARE